MAADGGFGATTCTVVIGKHVWIDSSYNSSHAFEARAGREVLLVFLVALVPGEELLTAGHIVLLAVPAIGTLNPESSDMVNESDVGGDFIAKGSM